MERERLMRHGATDGIYVDWRPAYSTKLHGKTPVSKRKKGRKVRGGRKQRGSKRVRPGFAPADSSLTKQI